MAIFHLNKRFGTRKGGQSGRAKSDYILREGSYRKGSAEVLYSSTGNMPGWAESSRDFWEAADLYERSNAVLFREIEFALPVELSLGQQAALAERFAAHLFDAYGAPYTLAIHAGRGTNPHCHIEFSERMNDGIEREPSQWFKRANKKQPEKGGAAKTVDFKRNAWLEQARADWAEIANEALAEAGHSARIDHRTLAEQGIDREPTWHVGPQNTARTRDGAERSLIEQHNEIVLDLNDARTAVTEAIEAEWLAQEQIAADRDLPPDDYIDEVIAALPEPKPAPARSDQNPDFVPTRIRETETAGPAPSPALGHDRDQEPRAERQPWPIEPPIVLDLVGPFSEPVPLERYGVRLADHGDAIRVASDPSGTPAQIAAALYVESKAKGWDRITFRNLDDEAADRVIEMARQDGKLDVIEFDDEKQQRRLEKAAAQEREFSQLVTEIPDDMGDMGLDPDPARPKADGPSL